MSKLLTTASRVKGMWTFGATVLLMLALAAASIGILVAVPLTIVAEILGWEDDAAETWLAISALIWLPIAVGNAFRLRSVKEIVERANRELDKFRAG